MSSTKDRFDKIEQTLANFSSTLELVTRKLLELEEDKKPIVPPERETIIIQSFQDILERVAVGTIGHIFPDGHIRVEVGASCPVEGEQEDTDALIMTTLDSLYGKIYSFVCFGIPVSIDIIPLFPNKRGSSFGDLLIAKECDNPTTLRSKYDMLQAYSSYFHTTLEIWETLDHRLLQQIHDQAVLETKREARRVRGFFESKVRAYE